MLRIKVIQSGSTRIYNTNSFKEGEAMKSEFNNFLIAMKHVDCGNKKIIGFEELITNAKVFVSPAMCLIEVEEIKEM